MVYLYNLSKVDNCLFKFSSPIIYKGEEPTHTFLSPSSLSSLQPLRALERELGQTKASPIGAAGGERLRGGAGVPSVFSSGRFWPHASSCGLVPVDGGGSPSFSGRAWWHWSTCFPFGELRRSKWSMARHSFEISSNKVRSEATFPFCVLVVLLSLGR
jgi:hypothetical protein